MATRRIREGAGSYGAGPSMHWTQQVPDLRAILGEVRFLIIGGLATRLYMPERMTLDVDVLVHTDDQAEAERKLVAAQARHQGPLTIGGSSWEFPGGRALDLIALELPWISEALAHPHQGPDGQPYADLPWLVLLKLHSSRTQDLADLARMLATAGSDSLDLVRQTVARHSPRDRDDIESLIKLGQMERGATSRD